MESPKITLLAIDDDPELLDLVSAVLSPSDDLEILAFGDPGSALEVIRRRRPEIVLVDLMMPGVSGIDILERIIEIDPTVHVILMTAYYTTDSVV